jgi:hypothetical protein
MLVIDSGLAEAQPDLLRRIARGGTRMRVGGGRHLTYCTNVHPAESLAEVRDMLVREVVPVAQRFAEPFGVGLRLSARAVSELAQPDALRRLRVLLDEHRLYVFTLNGFPWGDFHQRVKQSVYRPDWRTPERSEYTGRLALTLAALLPPLVETGSISTVPGMIRSEVTPAARAEVARRLRVLARALERLHQETGKEIVLALEPEPGCMLESTGDVIALFRDELDDAPSRRYLGLCLDACHLAVEGEDPARAVQSLAREHIRIAKLQLSTALEIGFDGADREAVAELNRFADDVYLHQVVERRAEEEPRRFLDLPDALAALGPGARNWRIHFHVPVFAEQLGRFRNTQRELVALLRAADDCPHLEVETYTWNVLPPEHRTESLTDGITRELKWVLKQL